MGDIVMAVTNGPSAREAKRLQTRERLMGAAVAEFKRSGMAEADVGAIVAAAGVAHGTFFFHFPTKEHVLIELERREEDRMAKQFGQFLESNDDLVSALNESVRLVLGLERRLGDYCSRTSSPCTSPRPGRPQRTVEITRWSSCSPNTSTSSEHAARSTPTSYR